MSRSRPLGPRLLFSVGSHRPSGLDDVRVRPVSSKTTLTVVLRRTSPSSGTDYDVGAGTLSRRRWRSSLKTDWVRLRRLTVPRPVYGRKVVPSSPPLTLPLPGMMAGGPGRTEGSGLGLLKGFVRSYASGSSSLTGDKLFRHSFHPRGFIDSVQS